MPFSFVAAPTGATVTYLPPDVSLFDVPAGSEELHRGSATKPVNAAGEAVATGPEVMGDPVTTASPAADAGTEADEADWFVIAVDV